MKRNFLLLTAFVSLALTAMAAPRTLEQMKTAAREALSAQARRAPGLSGDGQQAELKVLRQEPQLTVLGYDEGRFAVVANDDQFPSVLGYSDTSFGDEPAPGLLWWMQTMNATLERHLSTGQPLTTTLPSGDQQESVDQLVTCHWAQSSPYNNKLPSTGNTWSRYVTGCVATAMSQVMYYHRYPTTGTGSNTYTSTSNSGTTQTVSADFSSATYDYANMLDYYSSYAYTDAQADAVATLMFHCGVSVNMQYNTSGDGGSGAQLYDAAYALRKNFGYSPYLRFLWREFMPEEEWMDIIYTELSDGCPLLAGGVTDAGYGHAFVFDGYDAEGRVHVNWGWGGYGDGFFEVAALDGYTNQQMLIEVRKSDDERFRQQRQSLWCISDDLQMSITRGTITVSSSGGIYNMDLDTFYGNLALMAKNEDTGATTIVTQYTDVDDVAMLNGYSMNSFFTGSLSRLSPGTYRLYIASRADTEDTWQPVRSHEDVCNSYLLVKEGTTYTLTADPSGSWTTTDLHSVALTEASAANNMTHVYNAQGQLVYTGRSADFQLSHVPASGMLIVKQGTSARKVLR